MYNEDYFQDNEPVSILPNCSDIDSMENEDIITEAEMLFNKSIIHIIR